MPLLNISVPVNIEKWNTGSFEPLVVVQSNIKDESKLKLIKAFDKHGKIHMLDAQKAPDFPVVVVGFNERNEVVGGKVTMKKGLVLPKSEGDKMQTENYEVIYDGGGEGGGGTGTGGGGTGGGCTYGDNQWLYLKGMSSPDISQYESWWKGAPEITMQVFTPGSETNFTSLGKIRQIDEMEPGSRSDINNNNWWGVNYSVVYWNTSTIAKTLAFHFYEVDGGIPTTEINIGGSFKVNIPGIGEVSRTLGIKVNINDADDEIGQMLVDKCGPAPQANNGYDVGSAFNFRLGN
jgi:Protein of unknown function (DUF3103)